MQETEKRFNFKSFLISPLGKVAMIVVLYIAVLLLTTSIVELFSGIPVVMVVFAIAFGYFGWQALSKITPNIFLIMPVGGWIAYYVVKGLLSFFLGVFVAPFVIAKKITKTIERSLA